MPRKKKTEDVKDLAPGAEPGMEDGALNDKLPVELRLEQELAELEKGNNDADIKERDKPVGAEGRSALVVKAPDSVSVPARKIVNFFETDFKHLDRDLSDPERDEWNAIYASYRSKSILTGTVIGVDENELPVRNSETNQIEMRKIYSLVIIGYRVKVLIP